VAKQQQDESVGVPLAWVGLDDAEIVFANQILVQMGPPNNEAEFIVTFGQLHPPVLLGTPAENRARLESTPYVPVKVLAKLAIPAPRLREFADAIEKVLATFESTGKRAKRRVGRTR
jgi:hypothetical protein